MSARATASAWRAVGRWLLVAVGWIGFVWLWLLVAQRPWEVRGLVWLIGGSLIALPLLTLLWVWHNRSIYRRKGPRRATAVIEPDYARDWNGRAVQADWPMLRHARSITVAMTDELKQYQLGAAPSRPPRRT